MKRRDLLQSFVAAATFTRIPADQLKPDDVIVIEYPGIISQETADRLKTSLRDTAFPHHKIIVLGDGMKLRIVAGSRVDA